MKLLLELDTASLRDVAQLAAMLQGLTNPQSALPRREPVESDAPVIPQSIQKETKVVTAAPEQSPPTAQELSTSIDKAAEAPAEPAKPKREKKDKPHVTKTVTIDEVRAIMVDLSKKGPEEMDRQRTILTGMGFHKLSDVPPEKLMELKEKIEAA